MSKFEWYGDFFAKNTFRQPVSLFGFSYRSYAMKMERVDNDDGLLRWFSRAAHKKKLF